MAETGGSVQAMPTVPAGFVASARVVSLHRDANRWGLLYRLLYRLTHGEHHLLKITIDEDVVDQMMSMEKQVRRDIHKMHAFVRFRLVNDEAGEHFVAWHRPDHLIVPAMWGLGLPGDFRRCVGRS